MPEFTYTCPDETVVVIDSSTGKATVNGMTYHKPCTLEAENGSLFLKPIPLELFQSIDFSRIEKAELLRDGQYLGILPTSWTYMFMENMVTFSPTSTLGGKRCHC